MLSPREISQGLYGAWRLARLDKDAMSCFDISEQGLRRSFLVSVLILPVFLILTIYRFSGAQLPPHVGPFEIAVVQAAAYTLTWVVFPLAMLPLAEVMQRGERYAQYIVAINWAKIPIAALQITILVFIMASDGASASSSPLLTISFFAVAFYLWFIARTALQISGWVATALVVLTFTIEGLIEFTALSLLT